jgi:hypothetical protein
MVYTDYIPHRGSRCLVQCVGRCLNRTQVNRLGGPAGRARNRIRNQKYVRHQSQHVPGMYPFSLKKSLYTGKNKQKRMYSVRTGTYWYVTLVKVCTFSLKSVLLSCFLYSVRTEYILQVSKFLEKVRTCQWDHDKKYVTVLKRTRSSARWYNTIPEYEVVRTGTYRERTTSHDSRLDDDVVRIPDDRRRRTASEF